MISTASNFKVPFDHRQKFVSAQDNHKSRSSSSVTWQATQAACSPPVCKKNQWFIAYLNWIQKKKQTIKTPTLQPTYFVLRKDDLQMSWWYTTPTNQLIFTSRAAYPKSFGGLAPISLQLAHSHLKRSEGYKGCGGQLLAWQSCWLPSDCFKAPKIKAQLGLIFWLLELLCSNISITR